jgi:hypothetical protein
MTGSLLAKKRSKQKKERNKRKKTERERRAANSLTPAGLILSP